MVRLLASGTAHYLVPAVRVTERVGVQRRRLIGAEHARRDGDETTDPLAVTDLLEYRPLRSEAGDDVVHPGRRSVRLLLWVEAVVRERRTPTQHQDHHRDTRRC